MKIAAPATFLGAILAEYPHADEVREGVLVYGARLRNQMAWLQSQPESEAA